MSNRQPIRDIFSSTTYLKVVSFLAKFSDQEYHEREIARRTGISFGSANRVLNELFADGILVRRPAGKMRFYSFNSGDPIATIFKIFVSISLLRPLIKNLQEFASEIVLYGSCARGEDASASDVDLFVVSVEKDKVLRTINSFRFRQGFEHIRIAPVALSPVELLKSEKTDGEFLSLVREGIVLWDKMKHETGIQGMPESRQDHPIPPREKTRQ